MAIIIRLGFMVLTFLAMGLMSEARARPLDEAPGAWGRQDPRTKGRDLRALTAKRESGSWGFAGLVRYPVAPLRKPAGGGREERRLNGELFVVDEQDCESHCYKRVVDKIFGVVCYMYDGRPLGCAQIRQKQLAGGGD